METEKDLNEGHKEKLLEAMNAIIDVRDEAIKEGLARGLMNGAISSILAAVKLESVEYAN
mgnify:CR=1 FL=1|tara:strand:+ start:262 stop:441 length:180 start_codon:yes stop_codon:yes gene_type:complete